jgi:outer membrane protein assembly factor BamB
MMPRRLLFGLLLTMGLIAGPAFAGDNWPEFRGDGDGKASNADLPVNFSDSENVTWKTEIHGKGWSSPVVWGDQIWLTSANEGGSRRYAICVDKNTGEIIHNIALFNVAAPQYVHPFNSYASPTPAIEEGRVYITFGAAGTACLDTETGEVLWERRDLKCNHFRGAGSSPILFEDLLIMHFDGSDYQYVVALDKKTGETVWRTDRSIEFDDLNEDGEPTRDGDLRKAFATPTIMDVDGKPVLISLGAKAGYAYNPYTGNELWRYEERDNHSSSVRPVIGEGMVFCSTGLPRGELWAVRPGGEGVINGTDHIAWTVDRNVPKKPSILYHDGRLFMCDDNGVGTCLDAETGEAIWRDRIGGKYTASPLYADGRIYFFDETGKAKVIKADDEFEMLAENEFPSGFMASPAVSGDAMFLRTKTHLYRIEKRD